MAPTTSSPTVWRRWLGFELRRLRAAAGLTAQEAASILGCTPAKISYMERAERAIAPVDLGRLLDAYGVPADDRPWYEQARRDSRRKAWWEDYDERSLPGYLQLYVGLEQGADRLRVYESEVIHGLLQTPEYIAAVQHRAEGSRPDELVERLVKLRLARQEVLDRQPEPLELSVVLDEATLRREVGGRHVMAAQLDYLAAAAERSNITVQVLPFAAGAHGAYGGNFTILSFPFGVDAAVVYVEGQSSAVYYDVLEKIEIHSLAFKGISELALTPTASLAFIRTIAQEMTRA